MLKEKSRRRNKNPTILKYVFFIIVVECAKRTIDLLQRVNKIKTQNGAVALLNKTTD